MTTKYASPLAEAQAKLAAARNVASQARIALNQTTADRLVADSSYEQWREQWPNIDKREDRPTYRGPDGLAVSVDGSPYLIDGHQANRPDIYQPPPPSDETLAALESEVTKAEHKVKTATKAENIARAAWTPPENTGWLVVKPMRCAGIVYSVGDAFDQTTVDHLKMAQLQRVGRIRPA